MRYLILFIPLLGILAAYLVRRGRGDVMDRPEDYFDNNA